MSDYYFFVSITEKEPSRESTVAILNLASSARQLFGYGHTSFYIFARVKKSRDEVVSILEALPEIQKVSAVNLSTPLLPEEEEEIQQVISATGINTSEIADKRISSYFNSLIEGNPSHYIDFVHDQYQIHPKLVTKPFEEHPDYLTEGLIESFKLPPDRPDRVYTVEDVEITHCVEIDSISCDPKEEEQK